jgi:hypothetical protein
MSATLLSSTIVYPRHFLGDSTKGLDFDCTTIQFNDGFFTLRYSSSIFVKYETLNLSKFLVLSKGLALEDKS